MSRLPDQTRALRQTLAAVAGGFIGGFLVTLTLFTYAIVRFGWPEQRWWVLPHLLQGVVFSVTCGLIVAWLAMRLVMRRQHRLGMHRCLVCNRVLPHGDEPCVCDAEGRARYRRRQRLPNRMLRHYRRRVPAVVIINAIVLLIAWYAMTRPSHPRTWPIAAEVIFFQAILCIALAALLHLIECFEGLSKRGRRMRLRVAPFVQMLVMWPALCLAAMAICDTMWR